MSLDYLQPEFRTLEDVRVALSKLEGELLERKDRRGIFTTAYVRMTEEISRRIEGDDFADPAWVTVYTLAFANLYRTAFLSFEQGDLASVPKAWRLSFEASRSRKALLLQDLVLGVNAHVNNDLPSA